MGIMSRGGICLPVTPVVIPRLFCYLINGKLDLLFEVNSYIESILGKVVFGEARNLSETPV